MKVLYRIMSGMVILLFGITLTILILLAALSTSYISVDAFEHTFYVKDSVLLNFLTVVLLAAIGQFVKKSSRFLELEKKLATQDRLFGKIKWSLLFLVFLMGIVIVFGTQYIPGADQYSVVSAAWELRVGEYTMYEEDGYMAFYPHQAGLVVILYLLSFIFGNFNYIVFELLNVAGTVIICKALSEITGFFCKSRIEELEVIVLGILFLPLTFYDTFVYGNILGLAFALVAFRHAILFDRTYHIKHAAASAICIGTAIFIKNNYLIFLLGMFCYIILELIRKREKRLLILAALGILAFLSFTCSGRKWIEHKTGESLENGMSSWSYIAMGLHDSDMWGYGWFDGYNYFSYVNNDYNPEIQAEVSKEDIKDSLKKFESNGMWTYTFFSHKIASEWNNPTFQSLWVGQVRNSSILMGPVIKYVYSAEGSNKIAKYLDRLQFVILFGVLLNVVVNIKKRQEPEEMILYITFLGGFLFHLFWEAKGQYTFSYFVLLFPCTVRGFSSLGEWIKMVKMEMRGRKLAGVCAVGIVLFAGSLILSQMDMVKSLYADTDSYKEHIALHTRKKILPDGEYTICPKMVEAYQIDLDEMNVVITDQSEDNDKNVRLHTYEGETRIRFLQTDWYLDSSNGLHVQEIVPADFQEWTLQKTGENEYYILQGEYALTYDESQNQVTMSGITGEENQKWRIK